MSRFSDPEPATAHGASLVRGRESDVLSADGAREFVDLALRGRVVVLSACSSNTGVVLRGEGVMSLARAFFQPSPLIGTAQLPLPLQALSALTFVSNFAFSSDSAIRPRPPAPKITIGVLKADSTFFSAL